MPSIKSLPIEILEQIFTHLLPTPFTPELLTPSLGCKQEDFGHKSPGRDPKHNNMKIVPPHPCNDLMATCRYWRDIIISCPSLWSCLEIDVSRVSTRSGSQLGFLESVLGRSKELPLQLVLHVTRRAGVSSSSRTNNLHHDFAHLFDKIGRQIMILPLKLSTSLNWNAFTRQRTAAPRPAPLAEDSQQSPASASQPPTYAHSACPPN
ncbi:hypothetical protein M422DRAFT_784266 [Sphaerobolus stellatus SS14]|uniref:F-box domain-containing protein n=1 Tax=Sphaerobolus stellatus (strain SS14) TaxID=990650 RepID=A0A0C9UKU4_SPHS4|nr:hypothetical protein M422DRAFT_784266 [Sphaerobolus stellatus SS14]